MGLQKHYRTCNLCEAMCGLEIEHDGTRVTKIKGDADDPLSKGHICPKGAVIDQLHTDPNRLKKPLRKTADGGWEEISYKEAFDTIDEKINGIRRKHGMDAVSVFVGNPTVHNMGMMMYVGELIRSLRTKNVFSATSMDQLPHHFVGHYMLGHSLNIPIPDIDHTNYMIIMGANPVASNGSIMSAPGVDLRLKAIAKRGGKVILIDPRKTETAKVSTEHHFIRPGTDVYFLLSMLHLIFKNNWVNLGHLGNRVNGWEQIPHIAELFSPEKTASITGIPAVATEQITREFVEQEKAVIYGRMGTCTQEFGGLNLWLLTIINIATGHFDSRGGMMFTKPAVDVIAQKKFKQKHGRWHSRVSKLPEFSGELPVSVMAEEMLTEGKGQIRALITNAGNPVLSAPNGKLIDKALSKLDFMVSIDIFINETTRHADIILPPPSHLEVDHYDLVFNYFAVNNVAKYSPQLFKPLHGQLFDWQIVKELERRFSKLSGYKPSFLYRFGNPEWILRLGLLTGPYGKFSKLSQLFNGISLSKLKSAVHGVDLGPLQPRIQEILLTPDKKIHVANDVFLNAMDDLVKRFKSEEEKPRADNEFSLIGRRHLRSNNSWMHNAPGLMSGKNRCTIMVHPEDAAKNNLQDKQDVVVKSRTGQITIPVELTDTMMPGVVSIPHGFGHHKKGIKLDVAAANPGVSLNDITDQKRMDKLTGNAAFSGQTVFIEPILISA